MSLPPMLPDGRSMPNGTILIIEIKFPRSKKLYTHVGIKTEGRWNFSGRSGPHDAGWGAVLDWLSSQNRRVRAVHQVSRIEQLFGTQREQHAVLDPMPALGAATWSDQAEAENQLAEAAMVDDFDDEPNAGWPPMSSEDM